MTIPEETRSTVREIAAELLAGLRACEAEFPIFPDVNKRFARVRDVVHRCVMQLEALGIWGRDNQLPSSELWNVAGDVLRRGWMQNQARTRPRGYAGDYEMLSRMYENRLCDDPLGALFDRYFQEEAAPVAVRNRMRMMREWIVEEVEGRVLASGGREPPEKSSQVHVAMVGSAFGLEIKDALAALSPGARERVKVTLLDLDPAAIEFAKQQLAPLLPPEHLHAISANLFRLPERPQVAAALKDVDLLFCPGIFDYLDDAAARAMLRCFFERLSPGGRMMVFQFAPHNPTRTYMEWLGNWYLLYRTADEFEQVVMSAGLHAAAIEFGSEPLGVCLYASVSR